MIGLRLEILLNKIIASIGQFRADLAIVGLEFGAKAPLGGIGRAACAGAMAGLFSALPLVPLYLLPRLLPVPARLVAVLGVALLDVATTNPVVAVLAGQKTSQLIADEYANN